MLYLTFTKHHKAAQKIEAIFIKTFSYVKT